jgi:hypothetical protein
MIPTMPFLLLFLAFAGPLETHQNSADDVKVILLNARKKVIKTIESLPKYLCTETVDRYTFQPEITLEGASCAELAKERSSADFGLRKSTSDRLKLDVAVSGNSEMYSWAGEDHFSSHSLHSLVQNGATSTGTFASFLGSIFGTEAATFAYNGDVNAEGDVLAEFGFQVPVEKSSYSIRNSLADSIVGYGGVFWVDLKTFDLVRLSISADHLPIELNACETGTTLDYEHIQLNHADFLIPKDVHWHVVNLDGSEFTSRTVFSACHEFLGESTLRFDAAPEETQAAAPKSVMVLPPDLTFSLVLLDPISTATAAAGDLFRAKLAAAIRVKGGGISIPKDAIITGRIMRIERQYGPKSQSSMLGLKPETIQANGAAQPFHAQLGSAISRHKKVAGTLILRQNLGTFDEMSDQEDSAVDSLQFEHVKDGYVIPAGLRIEGRTAAMK